MSKLQSALERKTLWHMHFSMLPYQDPHKTQYKDVSALCMTAALNSNYCVGLLCPYSKKGI